MLPFGSTLLFVVANPDEVSGRGEGVPGDVKPVGACQELVGVLPVLQEVHERGELRRIFRPDVSGLADEVLRAADTTNLAVHSLATEAGIDDDGADD